MKGKLDIRRALVRSALAVAALVLVTVFINLSWFDEPLRPELVALQKPEPVSMDGNAYALIYGLPAAADTDPRQAGLEIIGRLRERYAAGERVTLEDGEIERILGASNADAGAWRADYPGLDCNSRFELDCAARLVADVERVRDVDSRLVLQLGRYDDVLAAPRFAEFQEADAYTPLPDYSLPMALARIRLARSLAHDDTPVFLDKAAVDFRFWRMMLRDGQSLVAKMIALAGMRNDMVFLSTLMAGRELDADEISALRGILVPLTASERDIGETFLAELRIAMLSHKSLVVMLGDASLPTSLTLQENATLNEFYVTAVQPMRLRATLSPEEFYRQKGNENIYFELRAFPPPLYNLGGKLILKRMAAGYNVQDYITRVHDLGGRISLLLLQAEIEAHPDTSIAAIVEHSAHRNPYTDEPMDYDAEAQTLGFECLAQGTKDFCAVAL